ncbi:MAG: hypothetical protein BMS9Abin28_0450 [Anaerolineae bacterium]|nr:MAG: hypothetical protein BMS9Abin28_0450 [Anaerolineae bacterium]
MILQLTLWSGIATLYLGIAGAVGIFSRQAITETPGARDRLLAASYSIALFLPATALVLAMVESALRFIILALAVAAIWAAYTRPSWIPEFVWRRTFTHRYLAGAMALAALWGISQALAGSSAAPLLISISAIAAAAASSGTALRASSIDAG